MFFHASGFTTGGDEPNLDSGVLSTRLDIGLKIAAAVGTFFGALIFGWLADTRGRKGMCEYTSNPRRSTLNTNISKMALSWL